MQNILSHVYEFKLDYKFILYTVLFVLIMEKLCKNKCMCSCFFFVMMMANESKKKQGDWPAKYLEWNLSRNSNVHQGQYNHGQRTM